MVADTYYREGVFVLDIKLTLASKPESNARIVLDPKLAEVLPIIKGNGDINLLCGKCGTLLIEGIFGGRIKDIIIHCPKCDSYNNIL
jgi:hypothetical protein